MCFLDNCAVGTIAAIGSTPMNSKQNSDRPDAPAPQDVIGLVQALGQSLNMAILYGVSHKVTQNSLDRSFPIVEKFIAAHDHLHFGLNEEMLLINGSSTAEAPLSAPLATRLSALSLLSFTLEQGFSRQDYNALFSLLLTPPARLASAGKSPAELLANAGLTHVAAQTFAYRRVAEDSAGNTAPLAGQTGGPIPPPAELVPPPQLPDVGNIMAFLRDEPGADQVRSAADIQALANDSEKLAEMILRTIEIRAQAANLSDGESLNDLVIGCIQKVISQMTKDPATRTQKGSKQIKRSLLMLEQALLQRLQALAGETAARSMESLVEDVADGLDADALAGKYMKSRKAAAKAEERLSALIARVGDDPEQLNELHDKLVREGLTPDGWRELTLKRPSPPTPTPIGSDEGLNEIKLLTRLLARIGETIHQVSPGNPPPANTLKALATETEAHLASLERITEAKIESLRKKLEDDRWDSLSRAEILTILAEIAQEISQPLTIICATAAMLSSSRTGSLTEVQAELLEMITESGARMEKLVASLARMAGTPEQLQPDQAILSAAYNQSNLT